MAIGIEANDRRIVVPAAPSSRSRYFQTSGQPRAASRLRAATSSAMAIGVEGRPSSSWASVQMSYFR